MRRNIAETLNRLSRAHKRYIRQTDGRAIAYSEREREFTFAKNDTDLRENTTKLLHYYGRLHSFSAGVRPLQFAHVCYFFILCRIHSTAYMRLLLQME